MDTATSNLLEHLRQHPKISLPDVAFVLEVGRERFDHRRMLVCRNVPDAISALATHDDQRVVTDYQATVDRAAVFMFPGQGAQYVNMGLELFETEPTFRDVVERCSALLKPRLQINLIDVLYPDDQQIQLATQQLGQTLISQPALFVVEYALARLWMQWGVRPQAMIGHSLGEYAAACLAGVFPLEDALALVSERARLIQSLPKGSMLAVSLPRHEIEPLLGDHLDLAAINEPSLCVVAGPTAAVEALQARLAGGEIPRRRVFRISPT